jgi:hypothetical protein
MGLAAASAASDQGITIKEGQKFFDRLVKLFQSYDPAIAELYSDASLISARWHFPNGEVRTVELTGRQLKSDVGTQIEKAKASGARSEFRNVRFEPEGVLLRIRAERYSVHKCYWDAGYNIVVGRQFDGSLAIIEESGDSQVEPACESQSRLNSSRKAFAVSAFPLVATIRPGPD